MMRDRIGKTMGCFALAAAMALFAAAALAKTQEDAATYKPGDRVEVHWGGKWVPASVSEMTRTGWVRVKLDDSKSDRSMAIPPGNVRPLEAAHAAATAIGASDNPFETADERARHAAPRTWTDSTGAHRIEGTLVKFENNQVVLKRTDGRQITLPLDRLSAADQAFLKQQAAASPAATPAAPSLSSAPPAASPKVTAADRAASRRDRAKFSQTLSSVAKNVDVGPATHWSYTPDPQASAAHLGPARIPLGKKELFEKPVSVLVSPQHSQAIVTYLNGPAKTSRMLICDLKNQKIDATEPLADGKIPLDMTTDMNRLLASTAGPGSRPGDTLDLFERTGKGLKPRTQWSPYGELRKHSDKELHWARFVDANHVATVNGAGLLVLWDISHDPQAVYQAEGERDALPALSAGGKYLALAVKGGVVLLDALSGNKAGFLPADETARGAVAFDAAGQQLALVTSDRIRVWDLPKRELTREFAAKARDEAVEWVDHDRLLIGGESLVDVPRRVLLWEYTNLGDAWKVSGGRLCFAGEDPASKDQVLIAGDAVPEAARAVERLKTDDLLLIHPGMKVSLELQLGSMEQHREAVMYRLKSRLEAAGMTVADGSNIKLVCAVTATGNSTTDYRTLDRRRTIEHSMTDQKVEITYQRDGRVVWSSRGAPRAPRMLVMRRGESLGHAINESVEQTFEHLTTLWLPSYVAGLPDGKPYGTSPGPVGG